MAQAINSNMRQTIPKTHAAPGEERLPFNVDNQRTFTGTTTTGNPRVKLDRTSKLILQILLSAMAVCGLAAVLLVRVRGALPHNPGSIAGTMSLVAGSRLVKEMPEDGGSLGKIRWRYRLGWWKGGVPVGEKEGRERAGEEEEGVRFGVDIVDCREMVYDARKERRDSHVRSESGLNAASSSTLTPVPEGIRIRMQRVGSRKRYLE
ncbi:MAG: hypothetical protein Q9227_006086 [Pyrenula ochraceoflavens]